jgi:hypothetical protein
MFIKNRHTPEKNDENANIVLAFYARIPRIPLGSHPVSGNFGTATDASLHRESCRARPMIRIEPRFTVYCRAAQFYRISMRVFYLPMWGHQPMNSGFSSSISCYRFPASNLLKIPHCNGRVWFGNLGKRWMRCFTVRISKVNSQCSQPLAYTGHQLDINGMFNGI